MSSIFKVLFLFWFVVISLLSSSYETDVRVELIAYDVWAAEDYKTGLLSVGVDIINRYYLEKQQISLPIVQISTIRQKIRNEDKWEISTYRNMIYIFHEWSKYYVGLYPPYGKTRKIEKYQSINFDEFPKYIFW